MVPEALQSLADVISGMRWYPNRSNRSAAHFFTRLPAMAEKPSLVGTKSVKLSQTSLRA